MRRMSPTEWQPFVMTGTRTGKLAVVRSGGRGHVTPVWFVVDGNDVVFTTDSGSVKARSLRRDPRATVCVDDQEPPYSYVMLAGPVAFSTDLTELHHWATIIGGRYMGADRAEEYGARNGVPSELLARLRVESFVGFHDLAA